MLRVFAAIAGCIILCFVLADAVDTIVLARRARRVSRISKWFYAVSWKTFSYAARRVRSGGFREQLLSSYGPLSLLMLLVLWVAGVILSFTLLQWSAGLRTTHGAMSVGFDFLFSAAALFTIALGQPANAPSQALMVVEAGFGFSLLGLVIGYLPMLYQSFADREQRISLLDARAGSPPCATELILRQGKSPGRLENQLATWEEWASDLLETQLSYPMLAYFRSQHENQSWLGSLVTILDASALTALCADGDLRHQAQLTFAMGRHALADLVTVFRLGPPAPGAADRLPDPDFDRMLAALDGAETALQPRRLSRGKLAKCRQLYEPFATALSERFLMALPGWLPSSSERDNWLRSSWGQQDPPYAVSDPFQAD